MKQEFNNFKSLDCNMLQLSHWIIIIIVKELVNIAAFAIDNQLCSCPKPAACFYLRGCVTEIITEILFGALQSILPYLKIILTIAIHQIGHFLS